MTRRAASQLGRPEVRPSANNPDGARILFAPEVLERFALLMLLSVACLRCCSQETLTFETPAWTRSLDLPTGPLPATTLLLTGVILAAAALTLAARRLRGGRLRPGLGELGVAMFGVAAAIATARTGQKRLALDGALSLVGMLVFFLALRDLLDRPWRVRLTLTTLLATGAVFAARCFYQVWIDYPATLEYFEEHRDEWVARAGELGTGALFDFEARLRSGAATGYFVHPNVAGGLLILVAAAAMALLSDARRATRPARPTLLLFGPLLVALAAATALVLTQSKGAAAGLALAVLAWAIGPRLRDRLARRRRAALAGFWTAAAAALLIVVAVGAVRGGLPGRSLLFRWQYWRGAAAIILDRGLWGVGPENFGRLFPRYKPVECPEEVLDPHSWIVRLAAEYGIVGLSGMVVLLIAVSRRVARGGPHELLLPHAAAAAPPNAGRAARWAGLIGAAVLVGWTLILSDASFDLLVLTLVPPLALWPATILLLHPSVCAQGRFDDSSPSPLIPALTGGAIGFLAHAAVDTSLFHPGAGTAFFTLLAILGARSPSATPADTVSPRPRPALVALLALGPALAAYGWFVVRPAAAAGAHLAAARRAAADAPDGWDEFQRSTTMERFRAALRADPLDATAAAELVPLLLARAREPRQFDETLRWLDLLRRRDPLNAAADRAESFLFARRFEFSNDPADLQRAADALRRWIAAHPTWPTSRIMLGRLLLRLNVLQPDPDRRDEARRCIETALDLDRHRIYVSAPNRLSSEQRAELEAEVARLQP